MEKRVVVVCGAANGLGKACGEHFASEGERVMLLDLDEPGLETLHRSLAGRGSEVEHFALDIRRQGECRAAVETTLERFARVDVLVNCAGVYPRVPVLEITEEDWQLDLGVNLLGTYFMMVEAIRPMREQGRGHIVNVSSVDALVAHPGNAHYAASKAAVVSITRSVAAEVAQYGIVVNAIAPGPMATERARQSDWYEGHLAALPTGRPIEPAEVAELVGFLSRRGNVSIVGNHVLIAGGYLIA